MVARITGFVTRASAGLRPPESVSHNIQPQLGGAAVHYGGPAQNLGSHASCVRRWRGWQDQHVDVKGWVDIAYTGGFCQHGYAFAGRGHGVRTAANGTDAGNDAYHAYVWLGGDGEIPTTKALDALDWWLAEGRRVGNNGNRVRPHRSFKSTACPGNLLVAHCTLRDRKPIPMPTTPAPAPAPAPTPPETPVAAFLIVDPREPHPQYLTDLLTKRWIQDQDERSDLLASFGSEIPMRKLSAQTLDRIPTVGQLPPPPTP